MLKLGHRLLYNFNKVVFLVNRIRELRLAQGMKQPDLACLLNCTAMTVSRYERGEADPDVATILRLCEIFGCTADYLLGRSPVASPELSHEEEDLLLAWRAAPPEIRAIIDTALGPYREDAAPGASAPTA